jgi:hypothetical protein
MVRIAVAFNGVSIIFIQPFMPQQAWKVYFHKEEGKLKVIFKTNIKKA